MNWLRTAGVEESLSARRAWIEMSFIIVYVKERGVALRKESVDRNKTLVILPKQLNRSLSARRAWIEICGGASVRPLAAVALRKESVDRNQGVHYDNYNLHCRSPQGERG